MERAVILEGARTPVGKFLGSFADVTAVELGTIAAREAMRRAAVEPDQIDQTIVGHARQAGNGPNTGRQVSVKAGVPVEVGAYNVNIACGSGMKAAQIGAQQIALGDSEVVLVGGMENMTRVPFLLPQMRLGYRLGNADVVDAMYRDGLLDPLSGLIMGETAENLVDMYDITRQEQDAFALESQQKAHDGTERRAAEIIGVEVAGPKGSTTTVAVDEHPRPDTTMEALGRLEPVFREGGSVTAGNSAGITDGAAAMVLMAESRATSEGREPLARILATSWAGRAARDHGHRPRARYQDRPGEGRTVARRHRPDRDQRGVRGAGHRVRTRAEDRPRQAERERRRHLDRPSDRHERRPHHPVPGLRDARAGCGARPGHALHLGRTGPGRHPRATLKGAPTDMSVHAVVLIQCEIDGIPEAAQAIADIEGVSEVYSVAGEFDLIAIVRVSQHDDLATVIPGGISKVDGVDRTETLIAFQVYSKHDLERLFSIGFEEG